MLDRIIKNWKTSIAAVIPAIVVIVGYWGFQIDPEKLATLAAAFYALLLIFSKDQPRE